MSFKLFIHENPVEIKFSRFPAGETFVSFDTGRTYPSNTVVFAQLTFNFQNNSEIFDMALIVDALRRHFIEEYNSTVEITLNIPYLPYGRQDRMCNTGESFSLKVFANLVNSLSFKKVYTNDAHSDVAGAVIDNLINIPQHIGAKDIYKYHNPLNTILVSPDSGALKKTLKFAKAFGYQEVVRADKIREIQSGKIVDTVVYSEHIGNANFLIIDDIGDGMGTFIPLAKKLRELTDGTVNLFVTHAIFSKGVEVVDGLFEYVYYHNNLSSYYSSETMNKNASFTIFTQL